MTTAGDTRRIFAFLQTNRRIRLTSPQPVEPRAVIVVVCSMSESATTRLFGGALSGTLLIMLILNAIVR